MIINNNMAALHSHRQINKNQGLATKSMEKLGSGIRINRAADDAAGLAISEKMRAQIRGLDQASRNAQDGISYIQTGEGSMQETQSILHRMRELAVQAANDTNTKEDRDELQKELNELTSEVNSIGVNTQFNTQQILRGTKAEIHGDIDYGDTTLQNVKIDIDSKLSTGQYKIEVDQIKIINPPFENSTNVNNVQIQSKSELPTGDYRVKVEFDYEEETTITQLGNTGITNIRFDGEENNNLVRSPYDNYSLNVNYHEVAILEQDEFGEPIEDEDGQPIITGYTYQYSVTISNGMGYSESWESPENERSVDEEPTPPNLVNEKIGNFYITGTLNKDSNLSTDFNLNGEGWISQLQTNPEGLPAGDPAAEWERLNNPDVNQSKTLGHGVTAHFKSGNLESGNADAVFTVDQDSGAVLTNSENEELDARVIRAGDQFVHFNTDFAMVSFDVKDEDVRDGHVTFEVFNPDEYFADLQIGANSGQKMTVDIRDVRANILGVSSNYAGAIATPNGITAHYMQTADVTFRPDIGWSEYALDISSHEKASDNILVIDEAIQQLSSERSKLGAFNNRLEHVISNANNASENLQAAESRIRDVDMAREVMEMTKNNILAQASQAMLAQANQAPQAVLQLLG